MDHSALRYMIANFESLTAIPMSISAGPFATIQRRLTENLFADRPACWPSLLRRRLRRWQFELNDDTIDTVIRNLQVATSTLNDSVVVSIVKLMLNGWTTSRRMQGGSYPCLLCGACSGDSVEHLIRCPEVAVMCAAWFPMMNPLGPPGEVARRCMLAAVMGRAEIAQTCIFVHVLCQIHRWLRHGSTASVGELAMSELRRTTRHCSQAAAFVGTVCSTMEDDVGV
jgi:hypothetical protein